MYRLALNELSFQHFDDTLRNGEFVRMDFPGFHPQTRTELPDHLVPALGLRSNPAELLEANQTWIAVLESEA